MQDDPLGPPITGCPVAHVKEHWRFHIISPGERAVTINAPGIPEAPWAEERPLGSLLQLERLSRWAWVLGYTAVLSTLAALQYRLGILPAGDLRDVSAIEQGLWQLLHHGAGAVSTITGHPLLADQASYVLVPLAHLYGIGGLGALLVLQAFALGLGYVLILSLGRQIGASRAAAHFAGILYLFHPVVLGAALSGFHPEALGVPLLFGLVGALLAERWGAYAALLAAFLLDSLWAPLAACAVGAVLLVRGPARWGLLTLLLGALVGAVDLDLVLPRLAGGSVPWWETHFGGLGATPAGGVMTLAAHPALLLGWAVRPEAWALLALLWGPVAAAVLARPPRAATVWWVPAAALCEAGLLSAHATLASPYVLATPFLAAVSLGALRERTPDSPGRMRIAWLVLLVLVLGGAAWQARQEGWEVSPRRLTALYAAIDAIPSRAPVAAEGLALAHLADRDEVWPLDSAARRFLPEGTYIVLGSRGRGGLSSPEAARLQQVLARAAQARVVLSRDDVKVYRLVQPLPPTVSR